MSQAGSARQVIALFDCQPVDCGKEVCLQATVQSHSAGFATHLLSIASCFEWTPLVISTYRLLIEVPLVPPYSTTQAYAAASDYVVHALGKKDRDHSMSDILGIVLSIKTIHAMYKSILDSLSEMSQTCAGHISTKKFVLFETHCLLR